MAPAKDGHFTKEGVEDKGYQQFTEMFTTESADSRISMSMCAQTPLALRDEWRTLRTSHILGAGVDPLLKLLDSNAGALAVLNTFGTLSVDRSPAAVSAAIRDFLNMTAKIHRHEGFQDLLMALLSMSIKTVHGVHQLAEWASAAGAPKSLSAAIARPKDQPAAAELAEWKSRSEGSSMEHMRRYLTTALTFKNTSYATRAAERSSRDRSRLREADTRLPSSRR